VIHVREGAPSIIDFSTATAVATTSAPTAADASVAAAEALPANKSPRREESSTTDAIVQQLVAMGFSPRMARTALEVADGNVDAALELCLSGSIPDMPEEEPEPAPQPRIHMIRRVINADNSCLFNAVGYVMHHDKTLSARLRSLISTTVLSDPEQYSEAFLGKPPAEYSAWIKDSSKWGGEIELSILSKHFGVEIAAVDIETNNVYIYGQDEGYPKRVYLLYDGIHYDALASNRSESASEATDQTQFAPDDEEPLEQTKRLAADLKARKQYVNLAGCDLQCLVCNRGLRGQKEALEHAQQTGHQNFGQIAR
jgi:ubiquitin thioesterase OTU1